MFKISLKAVFWILYPTIMCVQYNNQNLASTKYIYMYNEQAYVDNYTFLNSRTFTIFVQVKIVAFAVINFSSKNYHNISHKSK